MPRPATLRRMTNTQSEVYTTRRCDCTEPAATTTCGYPYCPTRRCGRCHVCRYVGVEQLPVLTSDEQRFLVAWNQLPNHMPQEQLTAAETRLVFKLADMGLIDA